MWKKLYFYDEKTVLFEKSSWMCTPPSTLCANQIHQLYGFMVMP